MKIITLILFLLLLSNLAPAANVTSTPADFGINYHSKQYISRSKMPPDMMFLTLGLEEYKKGYLNYSMKNFKISAKLGNEMSKYLVALVHFEQKDLVSGYVWLQLLEEPIDQSNDLLNKFASILTKEELSIAANKLIDLKREYHNKTGAQHRNKYLADLNQYK